MAVCLKWQLQHGSVSRIGGCQAFDSYHTFPSLWSTTASQLDAHIHTVTEVKRAAVETETPLQRWQEHKWCGNIGTVTPYSCTVRLISMNPSYHHTTWNYAEAYQETCSRDLTPFGITTKSPAGASEGGAYHRRHPATCLWQIPTFCHKYKALCCWADNGSADPK